MTFAEAVQLMMSGEKLTHRFFSSEEWVSMNGNEFIFEDGVRCSPTEFLSQRTDLAWGDDWSLFKEKAIVPQLHPPENH